jgi:tetratricopeptide (TPR) repeat protein
VSTFLALRVWRLFRSSDLSFYKFGLKANGVIRNAGWVFIFFSTVWLGVNAHSGWIRYHEYLGGQAFRQLQIPDELALASPDPGRWLSANDKRNIEDGSRHLKIATGNGFLTNADALQKLAWFEFLSGRAQNAVGLLDEAAAAQNGAGNALSLYYKGAILDRLGDHDAAIRSLDQAIGERPDLASAREEKGAALWQLGRRDAAIAEWEALTGETDSRILALNFLAGAYSDIDTTRSAAFEEKAETATLNDPLFHWMLGMRLEKLGMAVLAEKHFARAQELDPEFGRARN